MLQKLSEISILIFCLIVLALYECKPKSQNHTAFLIPPSDLKYFSLGYKEILADILWIRTLQDIDVCGESREVKETPDTQLQKKAEPHPEVKTSLAKCDDGWGFHMLDTITELAPQFEVPYIAGATILSVVVHDNHGAAILFKKGVERFPKNWQMSYRAAYHYMAAMSDYDTASKYLIQAGRTGAPTWVFSLAARLQSKIGQAILAKPILEEAIKADPESRWAPRLKERLKEIDQIILEESHR